MGNPSKVIGTIESIGASLRRQLETIATELRAIGSATKRPSKRDLDEIRARLEGIVGIADGLTKYGPPAVEARNAVVAAIMDALSAAGAVLHGAGLHKLHGAARSLDNAAPLFADAERTPTTAAPDDKPEDPTLPAKAVAVLLALHRTHGAAASLVTIEANSHPDHPVSKRTAGPMLNDFLIPLGLAERPYGHRAGVRLTPTGRRLAAKLATQAGA